MFVLYIYLQINTVQYSFQRPVWLSALRLTLTNRRCVKKPAVMKLNTVRLSL